MNEIIPGETKWEIAIYIGVGFLALFISGNVLKRQDWNLFDSETKEQKEERRSQTAKKRCTLFQKHLNNNTNNAQYILEDDTKISKMKKNKPYLVSNRSILNSPTGAARDAPPPPPPSSLSAAGSVPSSSSSSSSSIIQRSTTLPKNPVLKSTAEHPGLDSFHLWHDAIASIYRVYNTGSLDKDIIIPTLPKSERGYVSLYLQVYNYTSRDINVYWLDYKGNEDYRGTLKAHVGEWTQTTWIGHPWVFRDANSERIVLHFVPYRVIPTIEQAVTVSASNPHVGIHAFSIVTPLLNQSNFSIEDDDNYDGCICGIEDHIFPYPSTKISKIEDAIKFSIHQMEREKASPRILLKYLYKIIQHPDDSKYRQIRTSNPTFWKNVWCNGGRGVLHSLGFVENGAYAEMGPASDTNNSGHGTLSLERQRHVFDAIVMLENALENKNTGYRNGRAFQHQQPQGADGSGRAGWG